MPAFLLSFIVSSVLKIAFFFIEQKWPGLSPVLDGICKHVDSQEDSAKAVQKVSEHLSAMPGMPTLK